jgi:plastocyanin
VKELAMPVNRFSMSVIRFSGNEKDKPKPGGARKLEIETEESGDDSVAITVKQGDTVRFTWRKPDAEDFQKPRTLH